MKQKDVLTKNNDFLNVMFRGTPCIFINIFFSDKNRTLTFFSRKEYFKNTKYVYLKYLFKQSQSQKLGYI